MAPEVVEEVEPADEVIVRKRPARRVEEDEDVAPRVVQEAECVTRRTKVHDPRSGQTVIRREVRGGVNNVEAFHHWRCAQRHELG